MPVNIVSGWADKCPLASRYDGMACPVWLSSFGMDKRLIVCASLSLNALFLVLLASALLNGFHEEQRVEPGSPVSYTQTIKPHRHVLSGVVESEDREQPVSDGECKCSVCADHSPCCSKDKRKVVYLAIMCKSAPGNFDRRQKMRTAWSQQVKANTFYTQRILDRMVFFTFVIGSSSVPSVDASVEGESRLYNDTVVGDFKDRYQNLTAKLLWSLDWLRQSVRFRYLLMADDDAFISFHPLIQWLVVSPDNRFYAGKLEQQVLVVRDPESKWYVPRGFYGQATYPPYHQGFGYVVSCDMVEDSSRYVHAIPLFGIDDTVMGMLMYVAGTKAVLMPRFHAAPFYCQKFQDPHPLVIGDVETADYDQYTKDVLYIGCPVCANKPFKPPKSSSG